MKYLITISFLLSFVTFSQSDSVKIDTSLIYEYPDIEAGFPGGTSEMAKFLMSNFEYTDSARLYQENQKVWVEFVVNQDGSITNIKLLKGQKFNGKEMIRVISLMPNWIPAEIKGVKVKVRYTLPMNICLG